MLVLAVFKCNMGCKTFFEPELLLCLMVLGIVNINRSYKFRDNSDIRLDLKPLRS